MENQESYELNSSLVKNFIRKIVHTVQASILSAENFTVIFYVFRKFLQIFHVVFPSKISVNNSQEYDPASCNKKSAKQIFLFYRKIYRAENILDRIKPRSLKKKHCYLFFNFVINLFSSLKPM